MFLNRPRNIVLGRIAFHSIVRNNNAYKYIYVNIYVNIYNLYVDFFIYSDFKLQQLKILLNSRKNIF